MAMTTSVLGNLLREDNLMVNDDKTKDTMLKRFKHTKDSKNNPWRHRIK